MQIQVIGTHMKMKDLSEKVMDVIFETVQKLHDEAGVKVNGFGIVESEFTVKLDIEGMDEPQVVTVDHHGQPEMFKWIVNMDKDEANSNEQESEFDKYTVAKSRGEEVAFHEIESVYLESELQKIDTLSEKYGTMSKKVSEHTEGFKVVQVYQDDKLIQEYKLIPKEE